MLKRLALAALAVSLTLAVATLVNYSRAENTPPATATPAQSSSPPNSAAAPSPAPALSVAIAQPMHHGERWLDVRGFHVVVTNLSKQPQKVWRDWCSWGYFNLTFKLIDEKGKETNLKKEPRFWGANFPDFWVLDPGDELVIDVHAADFENFPKPGPTQTPGQGKKVRLQAVYEIPPDGFTAKEGVWCGRVESQIHDYVLISGEH
jgi:hypothetical protein